MIDRHGSSSGTIIMMVRALGSTRCTIMMIVHRLRSLALRCVVIKTTHALRSARCPQIIFPHRPRSLRCVVVMTTHALALFALGGCAGVEVKSSASVEAKQATWKDDSRPEVVAKVAVECVWKGGPAR